jgi:uncharacterized protein YeaO (DUF488 family)
VADVQSGKITRSMGYLVIVMRYYPRFLKREKVDEYARVLAPPAELFREFKDEDRKRKDHNAAFHFVHYEKRFAISDEGMSRLRELTEKSRHQDVYLICQCRSFERCHGDLLLIIAAKKFGAETAKIIFDYSDFPKSA